MKHVVIIGAGRLGKGFIGETFANSPAWDMDFIDCDTQVVQAMKDGYDVTVHRADRIDHHHVQGFHAYTWKDEMCMQCIKNADLIVFTIYPQQIPDAIKEVCRGLRKRMKDCPQKNVSIIFITNKNHLMHGIESMFQEEMGHEAQTWLHDKVTIRDSIVRRSTDAESNVSISIRTTAVLSLLIQQPLTIDISDVEWLELTDNLELLKDVKVFIVNGPHAASAFMGRYLGYETINEIEADAAGATFIRDVKKEIKEGILASYPLNEEELNNLSNFPTAKGEMIDFIYRVGYDPIRKLSKGDRLSGSAWLCYSHNLPYQHIAKAMAYGFLYQHDEDEKAKELQEKIQRDGIEQTIVDITGFAIHHEITKAVLSHYYQSLK